MRHRSQPAEHKLARDHMDLRVIVKDRTLLLICQHREEPPFAVGGILAQNAGAPVGGTQTATWCTAAYPMPLAQLRMFIWHLPGTCYVK